MTTRFFMIDTISGLQKGYIAKNAKPQYIRLANSIKLTVQLNSDEYERINTPLLEISYIEREELSISSEESTL